MPEGLTLASDTPVSTDWDAIERNRDMAIAEQIAADKARKPVLDAEPEPIEEAEAEPEPECEVITLAGYRPIPASWVAAVRDRRVPLPMSEEELDEAG